MLRLGIPGLATLMSTHIRMAFNAGLAIGSSGEGARNEPDSINEEAADAALEAASTVISASRAVLSRQDAEVAAGFLPVGARVLSRIQLSAQPLVVAGRRQPSQRAQPLAAAAECSPPSKQIGGVAAERRVALGERVQADVRRRAAVARLGPRDELADDLAGGARRLEADERPARPREGRQLDPPRGGADGVLRGDGLFHDCLR
jgi:hypothetical protein